MLDYEWNAESNIAVSIGSSFIIIKSGVNQFLL